MKKMEKQLKRQRRKMRVKSKVFGTSVRPRLSVFRSNMHIYAQIVNDEKGVTLVAATDLKSKDEKLNGVQKAELVGEEMAKKALSAKIKTVVFDRNGFKYHGRIKALADGARKGGLEF
jgi:large subunit ribosomal protein L18